MLARWDPLFLGAQTLQIVRDAVFAVGMPGVMPMGAGQPRHLQPRAFSNKRGRSQNLYGLQGSGTLVGNTHRPFLTRRHLVS